MIEPASKRPRAARPAAKRAGSSAPAAAAFDPSSLLQAMRALMQPVAALALARGVPYGALEDVLKAAFVDAARAAHAELPAHRIVSRISTATGINRREVSRLTALPDAAPAPRASAATRVFTRWLAEPSLRTRQGAAMALPRQGPAPSFEALAQSVTRDVHARSLLDELVRLGLARVDGDTGHLMHDRFVPRDDSERMLGFLAANVGDHLRAAVANVLTSASPPHLEQAVFADELSAESVEAFRAAMRAQWKALLERAVPALQQLIDADRDAGRVRDQRVRIGLYTYDETMPAAADGAEPAARAEPRRALKTREKRR